MLRFDAWLDRRCAERPVVLVVDDLQWADRSTLDAIMYVIAGPRPAGSPSSRRSGRARSGGASAAALARGRPAPAAHDRARARAARPAGRRRNRSCCSGDRRTSRSWTTCIGHARGNPYFTRLMVAGLSAESRAAPDAVPGRPPLGGAAVVVPRCRRRRGDLPRCSRSAAGRCTRTSSRRSWATDPAAFGSRLQAAVSSGTLVAVGDGAFWFHHPLNAEVLEAELVEEDRRDLHRRFADMIERRSSTSDAETDAAGAAAVRRHRRPPRCREADAAKAYEWALLAADLVGGADGRAEQLRLLRRAVALRGELPDADGIARSTLLRRLAQRGRRRRSDCR